MDARASIANLDSGPHAASATPARGESRWLPASFVVVGVLLAVFHNQVADAISALLPHHFLHRTGGPSGAWGDFELRGPGIVRATGIVVIIAGVAGMVRPPQKLLAAVREVVHARFTWLAVAVSTALGAWFGWLGAPLNAAHPHTYYHWVLEVYSEEPRRNYFTPQAIHRYFHDYPDLWQAINWALVGFFLILVAREIFGPRPLALALGAGVAMSGNLLFYAGGMEDVSVNVLVMAVVVWAVVTRKPIVTGIALVLATASRPSNVTLVIAFALAFAFSEAVAWRERARAPAAEEGGEAPWLNPFRRYVLVSLGAFVVAFAAYQVFLTIESHRWFLTGTAIIDYNSLAELEPVPVAGFSIYPLSLTYIGHALWTFPVVLWATVAVGFLFVGRMSPDARFDLSFTAAGAAGLILINEILVQKFYNHRYLTYAFPMILMGAWIVLGAGRKLWGETRPNVWRLAMALVLLAPVTVPFDAFEAKRERENLPTAEFVASRDDIRALVGTECVVVTGPREGRKGLRQATNFVFRNPRIAQADLDRAVRRGCAIVVFTGTAEAAELSASREVSWTDGQVIVFAAPAAG